jgi:acyl dehydratase
MPERQKIDYRQLEVGYEFSPGHYRLEASTVSLYIEAVEETSPLYRGSGIAPPMAVAANAIKALSEDILLPEGAVHVSQELEFSDIVHVNDTITCYSRVSKKQVRGKLHLMTVDFNMLDQNRRTVLTGKTSFILPQNSEDNIQ